MKGLKKLELDNLEVKENKKTKFTLGEIKIAKVHREATRPLKQIKDLTKEEIKNNSCPCCGLPTIIRGKLENYKMCNIPDELSNCGEGVVLYFSFFKFCIIITFIAVVGISILDSYISYNYYYELTKFCHKLNLLEMMHISIIHKCEVYSSALRMILESEHKEKTLFNSFFFKISLVNFRNYKIISKKLNYIIGNDKFESTIINLNFVNFLCLINIFIAYVAYIFFIYNKSKAVSYSVYTVGDYTIFLTNLNDIFRKFEEDLEYIQNKENELNNSKLDFKLYEEKLGFEPDKNMPKLNLFKKFLEKKLFQNYNINTIVLCYKLNEIMTLEKNIEELNEKIERIEFDQSMIKKNKGIKGDKRIYYSCLCCEESLKQIKMKKKDKEKKMNELIEASKGNALENFCGAAFVTFNSIKEQEDYLYQNNKNRCNRLMEALITLIKVYYYFLIPYICGSFCCFCCFCCYCSCCSCSDEEEDPLNSYKIKIRFERAPEPEDIIFENLEINFKTKFKNIICISFVSFIINFISSLIYGILYNYQARVDKLFDKTIILYVLSLIITIITSIFDLIFEIVL